MAEALTKFIKGKKYRIYFRGHREMVATYLGVSFNGFQFDLRPVAGTQTIRYGDILHAAQVSDNATHEIRN